MRQREIERETETDRQTDIHREKKRQGDRETEKGGYALRAPMAEWSYKISADTVSQSLSSVSSVSSESLGEQRARLFCSVALSCLKMSCLMYQITPELHPL